MYLAGHWFSSRFSLHFMYYLYEFWLGAQRPNGRKILSNVGGKLLSSEKSTDNISKQELCAVMCMS